MSGIEIGDAASYFDRLPDDNLAKLDNEDIVLLPAVHRGVLCYSQESIEFAKHCRETAPGFSIDLLDDGDVQTLSLNSIDIWMPVIWIAKDILLPLAVGLVASYINDKLQGRSGEKANVEVDFVVEREGEKKMLSYKGDADALKETFEKIDINSL